MPLVNLVSCNKSDSIIKNDSHPQYLHKTLIESFVTNLRFYLTNVLANVFLTLHLSYQHAQ
jgi:hypothetical protein